MQDQLMHVETGEEAEGTAEAIIKATVVVLPVVLQLLTLFRRPKAATATVSLSAGKPSATSAIGQTAAPIVER